MDEKVRQDLCEGLAELSAEVVELASPSVKEEWQRQATGEVSTNKERFLEYCDDKSFPLAHLQSLLSRQTEVARAVTDQEHSAWKMLNMITNLTKVIADQEHMIMSLQKERAGAERMAAEISVDLRTQYVEIASLKKRYDSAEEQLSSVQDTVNTLQAELKIKEKQLTFKEATIQELKQRLAQREEQQQNEKQGQEGIAQKRQETEKRLAEIRSILSLSNGNKTPMRATTNPRLEALRAARDSRLNEIRGLLKKGPTTSSPRKESTTTITTTPRQYGELVRDNSVSSTSEETMSDISSLDSSITDGGERHRLYEALVRQRQNLRAMP